MYFCDFLIKNVMFYGCIGYAEICFCLWVILFQGNANNVNIEHSMIGKNVNFIKLKKKRGIFKGKTISGVFFFLYN